MNFEGTSGGIERTAENWQWDFTAKTSSDLLKIEDALLRGPTQNALDEQVQMTRLLEFLASKSVLRFPLRVMHTGPTGIPDFQLISGNRRIAVEAAKIAVQDVEHARALQRRGLNRTLSISSLYRQQPEARSRAEVINEAFRIPAEHFPVPLEEYRQRWMDEATIQLNEKTAALLSGRFNRGDENWLLLWDRIGAPDWETDARIRQFNSLLQSFWELDWYSRVFLQGRDFQWLAMFNAGAVEIFPSRDAR